MQNTIYLSEESALQVQLRLIEVSKNDWIYGFKAAMRNKDKPIEEISKTDLQKIDNLIDVHRAFTDGSMQRLLGLDLDPEKVFDKWTKEAMHESSKKS